LYRRETERERERESWGLGAVSYRRKECGKLVSYINKCPLMGATLLHNGHLIKKAAI
jgi:hypothetical protein